MEIKEERLEGILIEVVNFDRATIGEANILRENISRGINDGYLKVIVDITECEYIDSTFLGVLVTALKHVVKDGGDVRLVGFKPAVHAMFELTRMFRVFQSYSDLQKAIRSFLE